MSEPAGGNKPAKIPISVEAVTSDQTLLGSKRLGKLLGKKVTQLNFKLPDTSETAVQKVTQISIEVKESSWINRFKLWLWDEEPNFRKIKMSVDGKNRKLLVRIDDIRTKLQEAVSRDVNVDQIVEGFSDEELSDVERYDYLLNDLVIHFSPQTKKTEEVAKRLFSSLAILQSNKVGINRGSSFSKEKLEKIQKLNTGCTKEELQQLGEAIENNRGYWKDNFEKLHDKLTREGKMPKEGSKGVLYLRKEETGLPRTLVVYKDGFVFIQLKRKGDLQALGKGAMKTAKYGLEWDRNKMVASTSVNISHLARNYKVKKAAVEELLNQEMSLLKKYSGEKGFLQVKHEVSYYTEKESGDIKMGIMMELGGLGTFPQYDAIKDNKELAALADVTEAVATLHRDGLVHGDLKPDNFFLVQAEERVEGKLGDFGLTKKATSIRSDYFGTANYVDPAFALNCLGDDTYFTDPKKNDIFSLGCILYERVTGQSHPFILINQELRSLCFEFSIGEATQQEIKDKKAELDDLYTLAQNDIRDKVQDEKIRDLLLRTFKPNQKDRISAEDFTKELRAISGS